MQTRNKLTLTMTDFAEVCNSIAAIGCVRAISACVVDSTLRVPALSSDDELRVSLEHLLTKLPSVLVKPRAIQWQFNYSMLLTPSCLLAPARECAVTRSVCVEQVDAQRRSSWHFRGRFTHRTLCSALSNTGSARQWRDGAHIGRSPRGAAHTHTRSLSLSLSNSSICVGVQERRVVV